MDPTAPPAISDISFRREVGLTAHVKNFTPPDSYLVVIDRFLLRRTRQIGKPRLVMAAPMTPAGSSAARLTLFEPKIAAALQLCRKAISVLDVRPDAVAARGALDEIFAMMSANLTPVDLDASAPGVPRRPLELVTREEGATDPAAADPVLPPDGQKN